MKKDVSILIPNFDSGLAIQLAIESIRHYTKYPNYQIIVWDDCSTEEGNLAYLEKAQMKGWCQLIKGKERLGHGGVLNWLINNICKTPYAVIMDCDVQILKEGWLEEFLEIARKDEKILAIVDYRDKDFVPWGFRCGMYGFWFGLLNMEGYRDGMSVDWEASRHNRAHEPFLAEFSDMYTPEFIQKMKDGKWEKLGFNAVRVDCDPGSALYLQAKYENPKGYKVIPLSQNLRDSYYHHQHISVFKTLGPPQGMLKEKHDRIGEELRKLRGEPS